MTKIGFVGLGRMGQPMAINCAKNGHEIAAYDIASERMQPFVEFNHCRQAVSAQDAVKDCEIAITVLPGPAEIDAVVLADDGLLAAMPKGAVLMDLSTILPETTDRLAAAAAERGCEFVDAPIGRLASHADRGESLFMVGASKAAFAKVKPVLEAMGTTIHHCGAAGTGTRTKLINNYLAITSCLMNAEAIALTQAFNLDLPTTLNVIHGTSATNGQLKLNYEQKVLKDDTEPGFAINLAHKDLSLIVNSAAQARVPMPLAAVAREGLNQAIAQGWGTTDFSGLGDYWCELAKVARARLPGTGT